MSKQEFRIVITPFCNYRCFFCHSEGLIEECTPLLLSPSDYEFIVKTGKEAWGWDTVTITGGEPLISPIYSKVCEKLKAIGMEITTVTNASLVSDPRTLLGNNKQVNISLHSMNPGTYRRITNTGYPLNQVLDTILSIRAQLPELDIHLNATVVRGLNDTPEEFEELIKFATKINAEMKFIDLSSPNSALVMPLEEITYQLITMGFTVDETLTWHTNLSRGDDRVVVCHCGFGDVEHKGLRDFFVNPDGIVSASSSGGMPINIFREVRDRDAEGLIAKLEWLYPEIKK